MIWDCLSFLDSYPISRRVYLLDKVSNSLTDSVTLIFATHLHSLFVANRLIYGLDSLPSTFVVL